MADEIEISLALPQEAPIPILSIPRSDVERLAAFPFRWLRYLMFTICGARGDICTINGPVTPVDYDETEIADDANTYYYLLFPRIAVHSVSTSLEACAFIDSEGLNDRITATVRTARLYRFRRNIIRRDGPACVVSHERKEDCDTVHLIPRSKGDEYIARVIELRSQAPRDDIGIDDRRNGVLLRKDLHSKLGRGEVAFIKTTTTPNSVLRPQDIKRFARCDPRQDYITLQWLKKPDYYDPASLADYQTRGNVAPPLPSVAVQMSMHSSEAKKARCHLPSSLDYAYGVAAYKCWRSRVHVGNGGIPEVINNYRSDHYSHIPPLPPTPPDVTAYADDTDHAPEPDDDTSDPDHIPGADAWKRHTSKRRGGSEMAKTMDELNMLLMRINGTTREEVAERKQKIIEQRERAAQEASRSKVMEWRKRMDVY
ncbi:hypothetical protein BC826DRAFT_971745 [Russula brevipes]|nr:hypothetical protein BC826DRAFT_971745 [Russula brevipes]